MTSRTRRDRSQSPMFSFSEAPVRTSQSRAVVKEWMASAATFQWLHSIFLAGLDQDGSYSKTFPASCRLTKDEDSNGSCVEWMNSGILAHGQAWTRSISEWRSGASACSLSDILETGDIPQRYFLSPKACAGIIRRAGNRGKELPTQLRRALEQVAGDSNEPERREGKTVSSPSAPHSALAATALAETDRQEPMSTLVIA